jgi:hypothetical protein
MLVPAGGLSDDGQTWIPPPARKRAFFVPVFALSEIFRGRFLALARRAAPDLALPDLPKSKRWVVFAKPVVHGAHKVLEYLGRYVHRTATTDKAIVHSSEHAVTFTYRNSRDGRRCSMTLPPDEFLRRFLQHIPPKGFHRVRAFGLLHPEHRRTLRRLQLILAPRSASPSVASTAPRPRTKCPHCGASPLLLLRRLSPIECIVAADELATTAFPRGPPSAMPTQARAT